ncbi:hypothetical protein VOLCADRAFT_94374 [Volvox carteri f. nagariensis]|uniref:Uncharacterized protein n=1 Tax=Volvox carteri f. nagariensis TaxID=3068 RepID=D8U4M1_VOLCA|nr:uncharacterized protein VOLCADRAFT_94374 [Volvox carteri f. nagariensis]EFJ45298.1 hypothetical protein VOLCADRAFT_94374 [Volvox carteri f. nagariensis]|eukprot:XP_002953674.1 hypothetical protein VOLCADRAFT_94374 [Volvox carteri f. nagariensis]
MFGPLHTHGHTDMGNPTGRGPPGRFALGPRPQKLSASSVHRPVHRPFCEKIAASSQSYDATALHVFNERPSMCALPCSKQISCRNQLRPRGSLGLNPKTNFCVVAGNGRVQGCFDAWSIRQNSELFEFQGTTATGS